MKKQYRISLILWAVLLLILCLPAYAAGKTPKNKLVTQNQITYYYNNKGQIVKNKLVTLKKKTYAFDQTGRMRKNELFSYKGSTYYAQKNGELAKNTFVTLNGKRWFFQSQGKQKTGWITWRKHKYYCPASGILYQNCWKKIGEHTYYFTSSGYIATGKWINGYYVNHDGCRVGKEAFPSSASSSTRKVIKMTNIKQNPQLPTGCESVALTMILKHYGFSLSKTTIASKYLPKSGSNFVTAFAGNPFSYSGAGIYSPGLTNTANKFLKVKKSSMRAYDLTGANLTDLYTYIDNNVPVIVWNSMYMRNPQPVFSHYSGGKRWKFFRYEHCVVLCGYDKANKKVLINDSLSGLVWRKVSSFQRIYNKMGKMAIVIQ